MCPTNMVTIHVYEYVYLSISHHWSNIFYIDNMPLFPFYTKITWRNIFVFFIKISISCTRWYYIVFKPNFTVTITIINLKHFRCLPCHATVSNFTQLLLQQNFKFIHNMVLNVSQPKTAVIMLQSLKIWIWMCWQQ